MKDVMKKTAIPTILIFCILFMVFIYEPIIMYASSIDDFWFNFSDLIKLNSLFLLLGLIISIIMFMIISFLVNNTKKHIYIYIYDFCLFVLSSGLIISYIHGNFLASKLPILDGNSVNWNNYTRENIISVVIILLVLVGHFVLFTKYREKRKNIIMFLSISIFFMLSTSLVSTLLTNEQIYKNKDTYTGTIKNINTLSNNKNFVILLADMVDSKIFEKELKSLKKEYLLKDFSYFPDTLSMYPYTRESIPYIFNGEYYTGETILSEWATKSFNNSKLIELMNNNDYDVNIYGPEVIWKDKKCLETKNYEKNKYRIGKRLFFNQEVKYILFKYSPFFLKKYSHYESIDYKKCKIVIGNDNVEYKSDSVQVYNTLNNIELQEKNYFQFLHYDGGHYPWDLDVNLNHVPRTTYNVRVDSAITVMEKYLERIKESGQYDNTVIIVLADHGDNNYEKVGRQNPSLYIKGINETHKKMIVSDKKVSYEDFNNSIYYDLLDGLKSTELLKDNDENRIRRFIWYKDYDDMYEQTLDGHAWETDKLKNTGNRYKR